jgi:hypothetical protein
MQKIFYMLLLLIGALFIACQSKPTVIEAKKSNESSALESVIQNTHNEVHTVIAKEVLQATKYTYVNVTENGEDFWIAIPGAEVEKGATYQYVGGLKKTNFVSRDFDRTFETIYLVAGLNRQDQNNATSAIDKAFAGIESVKPTTQIEPSEGGISLAELFTNMSKYKDQKVKVTGQCVKVNNSIMGRNWVHIQDGTKKGEENYDLTVTTEEVVPVGMTLSFEGIIALDKDFGAGYRYDIIMEEAIRK